VISGTGTPIDNAPEPVPALRAVLERRGISVVYAADAAAARDYVLGRIPHGSTVMTGGSVTVRAIGLEAALAAGNHDFLRPKVKAIEDREARVRERRRASGADYFVGGVNAVSLTGEIVNADGSGNRVAAYAFSAGRVFLVAGINKIVPDLAAAMDRLRNHAAAAECRGLGKRTPCAVTGRCDPYRCEAPERQCGKVLIIENEKIPGRITLVLVGQPLGY